MKWNSIHLIDFSPAGDRGVGDGQSAGAGRGIQEDLQLRRLRAAAQAPEESPHPAAQRRIGAQVSLSFCSHSEPLEAVEAANSP